MFVGAFKEPKFVPPVPAPSYNVIELSENPSVSTTNVQPGAIGLLTTSGDGVKSVALSETVEPVQS